MSDKLFLPDTTAERGGRSVSMDVLKPEITEIDETHKTIKIEGLAVDSDNLDKGTIIELVLMGDQIKIPRSIYNIKIIIEED